MSSGQEISVLVDNLERIKIQFRLEYLVLNTGNVSSLVTSLFSQAVLDAAEHEELLQTRKTRTEQCQLLYSTMMRKGPGGFIILLECLRSSGNDHIALELEKPLSTTELLRLHSVGIEGDGVERIWFDVKEAVPCFCGREVELEALMARAMERRTGPRQEYTFIFGMGGIGKTELARVFAFTFFKTFPLSHCIWLHGDSDSSLSNSLRRLAETKGLNIPLKNGLGEEKSTFDLVKEIFQELRRNPCLIVLDNVEEFGGTFEEFMEALAVLNPNQKRPFIIITTRNVKLLADADDVSLGVLSEEAGLEFVHRSLARFYTEDPLSEFVAESPSPLNLCQTFQFYPLALSQAVSYIAFENEKSLALDNVYFRIENYLKLFATEREKLLDFLPAIRSVHSYKQSAFLTLNLALGKLRANEKFGATAETILFILSLFSPDSIQTVFLREVFITFDVEWRQRHLEVENENIITVENVPLLKILTKFLCCKSGNVSDSGTNGQPSCSVKVPETNLDTINEALYLINRYSMFQMAKAEISIHRVVQEVLIISLEAKDLHQYLDILLQGFRYNGNILDVDTPNPSCYNGPNIVHVQSVWSHANLVIDLVTKHLRIPELVYDALISEIRQQEALSFSKKSLENFLQTLGPDHRSTLQMEANLAEAYHQRGLFQKALDILSALIEKQIRNLGPDDPDTLESRNTYGIVLMRNGQYPEALEQYQMVLKSRENVLEPNHRKLLAIRTNMAIIHDTMGHHEDSLHMYLDIYKAHCSSPELGPTHLQTIKVLDNTGLVYGRLGKHDEALTIFRDVSAMREIALGPRHPDTLRSNSQIGMALISLGQHAEALATLQNVLDTMQEVLGEDHHFVLGIKGTIGIALIKLSKLDEALQMFQEILTHQSTNLGPDKPDTLATKQNIGYILNKQGKWEEALKVLEEVYLCEVNRLGEHHPRVLQVQENMANSLRLLERNDEALVLYQHVLGERTLHNDYEECLSMKFYIAITLIKTGKSDEGIELLEEVCEASKELLGASNPKTLKCIEELVNQKARLGYTQ